MEVGKAITCYWNRNHFEILLDFRFQVALKRVFHFYNSELPLCMTLTLPYQDGESGWSSLHRALHFGHLAVASILLQFGASITLEDSKSRTPVDLLSGPVLQVVGNGLNSGIPCFIMTSFLRIMLLFLKINVDVTGNNLKFYACL